MIADANRQGTARAAFADNCDDHGNNQLRHLAQIVSNGLSLSTLFRIDARIGSGSVDETEDRSLELLGQLHRANRFAVALRLRHAKVSKLPLLCIASFLMPNNQRRHAVKTREATHKCRIVSVTSVAVNLGKVLEQSLDEIEGVRSLGMTRELDPLEGGGGMIWIQFVLSRHHKSTLSLARPRLALQPQNPPT